MMRINFKALKDNIGLILVSMLLASSGCIATIPAMAADNMTLPEGNITKPEPIVDKVNPTDIKFTPPAIVKALPPEIPTVMTIGQKIRLSENTEVTYIGREGTDNKYKATISAPEYMPDLTTKILPQWGYDVTNKQYYTKDNLFYAVVDYFTDKVLVSYEGKRYSWLPEVTVNGKLLDAGYPHTILVDPVNSNYIGNTIQWDYGNGLTRNLRLIEGMLIEYYTVATMPSGDIVIKNNTNKDDGFIWNRPVTVYDADYEIVPVSIVGDVTTLKVSDIKEYKLPITIDPDTTFTTSASDGYARKDDDDLNSWDLAHNGSGDDVYNTNIGVVVSVMSNPNYASNCYYISRAYLYFDTSDLPDTATLSAAELKLYGVSKTVYSAFNIRVQEGMPTYPHDPLVVGDYNYTYYDGSGGDLASGSMLTGAYNTLTLSADGRSWINKTGATKFILRELEHDINDSSIGREPEGSQRSNYFSFYSYEKGAGYRPELVVTYTASASPTVTTTAATDVALTTATVNSYLSDDGGEPCDIRFAYDTDSGAPYALATAWVEDTYSSGSYPSAGLTGLTADTPYYFRVEARNDTGTTNGDELTFTTTATLSAPTDFQIIPRSNSELSLSWTKGYGASTTHIRYSTGDYPATNTTGLEAYDGTGNSVLLGGLETGITYFFRAWGVDAGSYSTTNTTELGTTMAGVGGEDTFGIPDTPPNFFGPPTTDNLVNLPFYELINNAADNLDMPRTTLWIILFMGIAIAAGMVLYMLTGNPMMALLGTGGGIVYCWQTDLLPAWVLIAYCILAGSIWWMSAKGGESA